MNYTGYTMRKLNYKTKYMAQFFKDIDHYEITITKNIDDIEINTLDRDVAAEIAQLVVDNLPLTYQLEDADKTLVIYNPTL